MTYQEYKKQMQKDVNDLPIFFAFSNERFKEQMEERGLTENDTDKIYSLGNGGYYLKEDAEIIRMFFNGDDELEKLMKDYDFAKDAFLYEMRNHEYAINHQRDFDVLSCFYDIQYDMMYQYPEYLDSIGVNETVKKAYSDARKEYFYTQE